MEVHIEDSNAEGVIPCPPITPDYRQERFRVAQHASVLDIVARRTDIGGLLINYPIVVLVVLGQGSIYH